MTSTWQEKCREILRWGERGVRSVVCCSVWGWRAIDRQRNNWKSCDIAHLQVELVVNVEQAIDQLKQNSIQFVSS